MAKKQSRDTRQVRRQSDRKSGKKMPKKPLIDPRYKNLVNTIIILLILLIFFIVNNTRDEPESGPYPPHYNKDSARSILD